jgi:hypothetical protein
LGNPRHPQVKIHRGSRPRAPAVLSHPFKKPPAPRLPAWRALPHAALLWRASSSTRRKVSTPNGFVR